MFNYILVTYTKKHTLKNVLTRESNYTANKIKVIANCLPMVSWPISTRKTQQPGWTAWHVSGLNNNGMAKKNNIIGFNISTFNVYTSTSEWLGRYCRMLPYHWACCASESISCWRLYPMYSKRRRSISVQSRNMQMLEDIGINRHCVTPLLCCALSGNRVIIWVVCKI